MSGHGTYVFNRVIQNKRKQDVDATLDDNGVRHLEGIWNATFKKMKKHHIGKETDCVHNGSPVKRIT